MLIKPVAKPKRNQYGTPARSQPPEKSSEMIKEVITAAAALKEMY